MSLASRLFNVLATPGEVFEQVAPRPVETANWLVPALLLIVVSWLGLWLIFSQEAIRHQLGELTEQAIQKQAASQHMNDQQAEQARQMGVKWGLIGGIAGGAISSVLVALFTPFIWGFILWVVGDKIMKGGIAYMKAVELVGMANMIVVLEAIVKTLLIVVLSNLYASLSLAMLIKHFDPQNPLHGMAVYVNIMTFWVLAVRAVALARLARASFLKAASWVFGIWIAYSGVFIGIGLGLAALLKRLAPH